MPPRTWPFPQPILRLITRTLTKPQRHASSNPFPHPASPHRQASSSTSPPMATPSTIVLRRTASPFAFTVPGAPAPGADEAAARVLQLNHDRWHIFYHQEGFHSRLGFSVFGLVGLRDFGWGVCSGSLLLRGDGWEMAGEGEMTGWDGKRGGLAVVLVPRHGSRSIYGC
jgi:hypothetical protein